MDRQRMGHSIVQRPLNRPDGFDVWCDKMWRLCSPMQVRCPDPRRFRAALRTWDVGPLGVTLFSAPSYQARQTSSEIHKAQRQRLILTIPASGQCTFSQFGRDVDLAPGDAAFHVTKAPLNYRQSVDTTAWIFSIPLEFAQQHVDDPDALCAERISTDLSGYRTIREFLVNLPNDLGAMSAPARAIYAQAALTSICALLLEKRGDVPLERSTIARQRLRQIKAYIDQNMSHSNLTPHAIAQGNAISLRYLHHLFKMDGMTVSTWVKHRRLEKCRRALTDDHFELMSINEISDRFGFASDAQLRRAFRQKFGTSPSAFRQNSNR